MSDFRIAVRAFPPFEAAIRKQWDAFEATAKTGRRLDAVPLDLHPLHGALFGAEAGQWDAAFVVTDWIAEASSANTLLDLKPFLAEDAPDGFPDGWTDSLLRFQDIGGRVLGLPYHDGPECLIYRTDLLRDVPRTW